MIDKIIELFEGFVEYSKFTDGITVGEVIGWLIAAVCGIVAYKVVHRMQTSLERHNMLHMLEQDISNLYDSKIALSTTIRKSDISLHMEHLVLLDNLIIHLLILVYIHVVLET